LYIHVMKYLMIACLLILTFKVQSQNKLGLKILPRTIVTTDGEIDDVDTFIRMLLYSNEYKVEGLVYSSSMWHYKGDGKGTLFASEMEMTKKMYGAKTSLRWAGVNWIQDLLNAYTQVHPNLILHDKNYPSPSYLKSLVKVGNIDFEGEMDKVTEGAVWIKDKLMDKNPAPIYLQAWGGTNTIARALKLIEDQYVSTAQWEKIKDQISRKAIIYTVMDQDATYKKYIGVHWPKIVVFYNAHQFGSFAYPWKKTIPKSMQSYFEGAYMSSKIILNHGALLKMYYAYGDGQKQAGDEEHTHGDPTKITNTQWGSFEKYDFISEGDSPAFLQLVDIGLDNTNHPNYGGWGGRFVATADNPFRYEDGPSAADFNPELNKLDINFPQTRWLVAVQEDFAARANWCVQSFKEANHAPTIRVKEGTSINGRPGQSITLHIRSTDPDQNLVNIKAWPYAELSAGAIDLSFKNHLLKAQIPITAKKGDLYHIIVEGTDNGSPALTRYRRVVVTVQ